MVHIKDSLLLIGKSNPRSGDSGIPLSLSEWSWNVLNASLNKAFSLPPPPPLPTPAVSFKGIYLTNNPYNDRQLRNVQLKQLVVTEVTDSGNSYLNLY